MPILFRDFYTCEKCKKEFEWVKFELDRQDGRASSYYVQKIPNEPKAYVLNQDGNNYELSVVCPFCDFENIFTYEDK